MDAPKPPTMAGEPKIPSGDTLQLAASLLQDSGLGKWLKALGALDDVTKRGS